MKVLVITITIISFVPSLYGENLIVCLQEECKFKDIQSAIDFATPYSTILIDKGVYILKEELLIRKPLKIQGKSKESILDGNHLKNVIRISETENVEISDFIIQNSGYSDIQEFAGIYIEKTKNCKIHNNFLINNTYGIYLAYVQNCILEKNHIISNAINEVQSGNGIHLWYSYDNILKNNLIKKHRDGLYFEYSENLIVENNISIQNIRYGIHFMFCHSSKIHRNYFLWNESGIALMYSNRLELGNNRIEYTWGRGLKALLLKDINESEIHHNYFYSNTSAIYTDNSNRNKIYKNQFIKNGIAMEILGNSYTNEITLNYFENNLFDVATNSRSNPNLYKENFWDKYKGYDLNKDGYGDVFYRPVSLFSFWVSKYSDISILLRSPMIDFLETLEKVFPMIIPADLKDEKPIFKKQIILNAL
ncbi:MAG: nitrous oxide reductase family maturation protein NosD [Leptonema sp. (in: bacteria)]